MAKLRNGSSLTHEINNKIGVIITQCELIKRHAKLDHESMIRLQAIDNAAETVAQIIRDAADRSVQSISTKEKTFRLAAGSPAPGLTIGSRADVGKGPFPITERMLKMGGAGPALRRLRVEMGLTMRDVEAASAALARKYQSHEFALSISRLCDFETKGVIPSIHRLYSLTTIYRQSFHQFLQLYGVDYQPCPIFDDAHSPVASEPYGPLALPPKSQDILGDRGRAFQSRKTVYLGEIAGQLKTLFLQYLDQLADSTFTCAVIGSEDRTMYPLLPLASVVVIDEKRNRVKNGGWNSEYERPIYFVESREKLMSCWCTVTREGLILIPHPLSPVQPQFLGHHDAEVLGQVVGAVLPLGQPSCLDGQRTTFG